MCFMRTHVIGQCKNLQKKAKFYRSKWVQSLLSDDGFIKKDVLEFPNYDVFIESKGIGDRPVYEGNKILYMVSEVAG